MQLYTSISAFQVFLNASHLLTIKTSAIFYILIGLYSSCKLWIELQLLKENHEF